MTLIEAPESVTPLGRFVRRRDRRQGPGFWRYAASRARTGALVVVGVALTVFVVTRLAGDPARTLAGSEATPEQYEAIKRSLGLDASIPAQLVDYVKDMLTLNFGVSYWQGTSVLGLIEAYLPNTIALVGVAMILATVVGTVLGVVASLRPASFLDQVVSSISLTGLALPQFWLGALLILVFAVNLGVLPTSGYGLDSHIVLPAVTLSMAAMGRIAQVVRTSMIDELGRQHIKVARAKGFSTLYIIRRHALRNVLIPIVTVISFETVYALAGSAIIVETVFSWPGIGRLTIQAIQRQDLPLVQGIVFLLALIVVGWNLLTDLIYRAIDPRIELR
jgi:peptide/nickel transport system permease protein